MFPDILMTLWIYQWEQEKQKSQTNFNLTSKRESSGCLPISFFIVFGLKLLRNRSSDHIFNLEDHYIRLKFVWVYKSYTLNLGGGG